jgi:hypothetical protein
MRAAEKRCSNRRRTARRSSERTWGSCLIASSKLIQWKATDAFCLGQPRDTRRKMTLRQRSTWDPCRGEVFTIGALSHFNGCRARQRKNVRLRSQSIHFYTDINPGAGESGRTELPQREASPHALRTHCEFSQAHRRPTRGDFARDTQHSSLPQRRMRNCEYSITSRAQQRSCREGRSTLSQSFQLYRAP